MYRVMIVDDELLSRVGLKSFIDWNKHGFELVAECDNGQSAVEKAKELDPDIIITDIKMPVMDGVKLIELLKKEGIRAKVLVLSAYNDFEFVKESLKSGAEDYILKFEMEPEKFIETLKYVTGKIESEGNYLNRIYEDNIRILRENFIKKLLFGMFDDDRAVSEQAELLKMPFGENGLCCILIRILNSSVFSEYEGAELDSLYSTVINTINEVITNFGNGMAVNIESNIFAVVVSISGAGESAIKRVTADVGQFLSNALNLQTNIYASSFCESWIQLNDVYLEAVRHLKEPGKGPESFNADKEIYELNRALQNFEIKDAERILNALKNRIKERGNTYREYIHGIFYIIVFMIDSFCQDWKIDRDQIWSGSNPHNFINSTAAPEEYRAWLETTGRRIVATFNEDSDSKMVIIKAKLYIKKNYMKQLSLEQVAKQFELSSNYFSRIFRDETGITFIDYLIQVRVNKARELIKNSNYKIYEICEMVGYDDPHYFSRIFKKVTGVSPIEYK